MLTERRRRFVDRYVMHGNQTLAAEEAGFKQPAVTGCKLMKDKTVRAAIKAAQKPAEEAAWLTREERLVLLSGICAGKIGDVEVSLSGDLVRDPKTDEPLQVTKVKDRIKAAEVMSRMLGEFIEKREHSGPGGAAISVRNVEPTPEEALSMLEAEARKNPELAGRLKKLGGGT